MRALRTRLASWLELKKAEWLAKQEAQWQIAYQPRLEALRQQLATESADAQEVVAKEQRLRRQLEQTVQDVEDLQRRQLDRKEELVKANEELRQQLRLLEAKARPDAVWVTAFQAGYEKAWETMMPPLLDGVQKMKETLRQAALESAMQTVEPAIEQRVKERLNDIQRLRTFTELTAKRSELEQKRIAAPMTDQPRYDHYLEALGWALDGHHSTS